MNNLPAAAQRIRATEAKHLKRSLALLEARFQRCIKPFLSRPSSLLFGASTCVINL